MLSNYNFIEWQNFETDKLGGYRSEGYAIIVIPLKYTALVRDISDETYVEEIKYVYFKLPSLKGNWGISVNPDVIDNTGDCLLHFSNSEVYVMKRVVGSIWK